MLNNIRQKKPDALSWTDPCKILGKITEESEAERTPPSQPTALNNQGTDPSQPERTSLSSPEWAPTRPSCWSRPRWTCPRRYIIIIFNYELLFSLCFSFRVCSSQRAVCATAVKKRQFLSIINLLKCMVKFNYCLYLFLCMFEVWFVAYHESVWLFPS